MDATQTGGDHELARGTQKQHPTEPPVVAPSTRERISDAALQAFEMYGINRLKVEDVARLASVSKPTIYRAFPDRPSLLLEILIRLGGQLNDEIHRKIPLDTKFADVLDRSMVMTLDMYSSSRHLQELVGRSHGENIVARYSYESERLRNVFRDRWMRYIEAAASRGELKPGLDYEGLILWLIFIHASLVSYVDFFDNDIDKIRTYYREFSTRALLEA